MMFLSDMRQFGISVAWYNLKWNFCYWLLEAKQMSVVHRDDDDEEVEEIAEQ